MKFQYKTLITPALSGLIIGVAFIFVQPLFGMSPLTERHAQGYMSLSSMNYGTAITLAWLAHLFVSACYGMAMGIALKMSNKFVPLIVFQILTLGWITTILAPPANALLVKVIGSGVFPVLSSLPSFNFTLDAKLSLHVMFFAAIALLLYLYERRAVLARFIESLRPAVQ